MNRALLVGINKYPGAELNGCINDVEDMAQFLVKKHLFKEQEIRLLHGVDGKRANGIDAQLIELCGCQRVNCG